MGIEEVGRLLVSFLIGGLLTKLVDQYLVDKSNRKQRELEHLREQLKLAYGPLFYFASQNEMFFGFNKKIHGAYNQYFGQDWDTSQETRDHLNTEMTKTLELANNYVYRVVENNRMIMQILERNWHIIDTEDLPTFSQFQVDFNRYQTEICEGKGLGVPLEIHRILGEISYMYPSVTPLIQKKFEMKRDRLNVLSEAPRSTWQLSRNALNAIMLALKNRLC